MTIILNQPRIFVTYKARELWDEGIHELYVIYSDNSESLITDKLELELALEGKLTIGMKVNQISINK